MSRQVKMASDDGGDVTERDTLVGHPCNRVPAGALVLEIVPEGEVDDTVRCRGGSPQTVGVVEAVAITAGAHGNSLRPDITTVPLDGVEPSHVVLATRAGDRSRLVAAFRKLAEAHLTGPSC